jgi:asparagine synthase (glutamine-hydrolysing)
MLQVQQTSDDLRSRLWRPELGSRLRAGLPPRLVAEFRDDLSPLRRVQRLDFTTYLPDSILTKVDIASMMWGLEVRTPLLDLRVVEHAAAMPESLVAGVDRAGELVGKLPLKRLLQRVFPAELTDRPKQGFTVPFERWLSPGGRLHDAVSRRLQDPASPLGELFAPGPLAAVGRGGPHQVLWLLLVLDEWLRQLRAGSAPPGGAAQVTHQV